MAAFNKAAEWALQFAEDAAASPARLPAQPLHREGGSAAGALCPAQQVPAGFQCPGLNPTAGWDCSRL